MILDISTKLEAVLAGSVAANQPEVHVNYLDYNNENTPTIPSPFRVALNSTTDVTILSAPTLNPRREVLFLSIYNKDTAEVTATIKTDDGTTERIIVKVPIPAGRTLSWQKGSIWQLS